MGLRARTAQVVADLVGLGQIVAARLGASNSVELQSKVSDDDNSTPFEELWGHAPLLYKPLPDAERLHIQLGDERVIFATKDRRWQIAVRDGEVVVRAMGGGSPAYVQLKPDGTAIVNAGSVNLGGAATQFVALANLVTQQFTALKSAISGAGVTSGDGGAAFKAALLTALSAWPGNVAATKVKAE